MEQSVCALGQWLGYSEAFVVHSCQKAPAVPHFSILLTLRAHSVLASEIAVYYCMLLDLIWDVCFVKD